MQGSNLPDLIALAFESACDQGGLKDFVAAAGGYFGAQGAAMVIWPRAAPEALIPILYNIEEPELLAWFEDRELSGSLFERLASYPALTSFDGSASTEGWPDGTVLATVVDRDDANICGLILQRPAGAAFSQADQDALTRVSGYLRRAIALNRRFIRIFAEQRASRLLLDGAPRGILVLGQTGQSNYLNNEARRICANEDGVYLEDEYLRFSDADANHAYAEFLETARLGRNNPGPVSTGIRIERTRPDMPAYQLLLYALLFDPRQAALDHREGLAIAMLHDPVATVAPNDALLDTYFSLTPAEAHVTQALCSGRSLPTAAQELSISVNTARTHLRNVFQKVGVHSQAALVQRVTQSLHYANPLS